MAIMLSRMLSWSRVLFLDDDIAGLEPADMQRASGLLDIYNVVGLKVAGFPGHSVVCHAYRQAGGDQQEFIGGGAMVVQLDRSSSFFPEIYNEDWFFLLDAKGGLQPVTVSGEVIQDPYDPFRPGRARAEELGDVLAEGIYGLLDQGQSVFDADEEYWREFLRHRRQFILQVTEMVRDSGLEAAEKRRRLAVLEKGSLIRLADITPALCVAYLQAWASDRERWQQHLDQLPTGLTRQEAINALARPGRPPLVAYLRQGNTSLAAARSLDSLPQNVRTGLGERDDQLAGNYR
ncbi:MAG: hypothetical protein ABJB47_15170 [Actinomycetota bacterium]